MIEKEDVSKYLSIDNGKGLLLKNDDAFVLEHYGFDYLGYSSLSELIFVVGNYLDEHYEDDTEDLEEVLSNLLEMHYYYEIKK